MSTTLPEIIITFSVFAFVIAMPFIVNSNNTGALKALKMDGFSNTSIEGYAFLGCGSDDSYRKSFSGTKNNIVIEGYICGGPFKGYTVRYK